MFWYYLGVGRYRHDNEDRYRKLSEKLHGNIFSGVNFIFWNSVWTKLWVNFVKYFKRIRLSFFSPRAPKSCPFFANFSPILCPLFSPGKIGTSNLVHDCTWHSKVNQMEFCRLLWRSFFSELLLSSQAERYWSSFFCQIGPKII